MLEKPAYLLGDFIIEIGLAGSTGLCIIEAVFGQLRDPSYPHIHTPIIPLSTLEV